MSTYAFASHRVAASSSGFVEGWQTSGQIVGDEKRATEASATTAVRMRVKTNGASTLRAANTAAMLGARKVDPVPSREFDRVRIPRVGVAHHTGPGVRREHAPELLAAERRAIRDGDHAGVDRVSDADASAVMDRDPRRAGGCVHERVQDRPVRDGVAAVAHVLGFAERRGDRPRVEVIAADNDGRLELAFRDEVVDPLAERGAFPVSEPADPRRKSLEWHPISGKPDPPRE